MTLSKINKLVNFCNEIVVKQNPTIKGLCSYFEYKGVQYYASFIWTNELGPDFAVFPALDKSVKSWTSIYRNNDASLVTVKEFRECIFNFLVSL